MFLLDIGHYILNSLSLLTSAGILCIVGGDMGCHIDYHPLIRLEIRSQNTKCHVIPNWSLRYHIIIILTNIKFLDIILFILRQVCRQWSYSANSILDMFDFIWSPFEFNYSSMVSNFLFMMGSIAICSKINSTEFVCNFWFFIQISNFITEFQIWIFAVPCETESFFFSVSETSYSDLWIGDWINRHCMTRTNEWITIPKRAPANSVDLNEIQMLRLASCWLSSPLYSLTRFRWNFNELRWTRINSRKTLKSCKLHRTSYESNSTQSKSVEVEFDELSLNEFSKRLLIVHLSL